LESDGPLSECDVGAMSSSTHQWALGTWRISFPPSTSSTSSKQGKAPPTSGGSGEIQVAPTHAALFMVMFWLGLGLAAPTLGCSGIHSPCPLSQLHLPQHMYQDLKTGM